MFFWVFLVMPYTSNECVGETKIHTLCGRSTESLPIFSPTSLFNTFSFKCSGIFICRVQLLKYTISTYETRSTTQLGFFFWKPFHALSHILHYMDAYSTIKFLTSIVCIDFMIISNFLLAPKVFQTPQEFLILNQLYSH